MFTNKKEYFDHVKKFKNEAILDGWKIVPTYETESVENAATLEKESYNMMIILRDKNCGKWRYEAEILIWCPDGIAIFVPQEYNWEQIKKNRFRCDNCKRYIRKTFLVGFANRSCEGCLPEMKKKIEFDRWNV